MKINGLLKSQVAELARAIARAGLPAEEFESGTHQVSDLPGFEHCSGITHLPTGAAFLIGRQMVANVYGDYVDDMGVQIALFPGDQTIVEQLGPVHWPEILTGFHDWLTYVKRERDAPDFLAAFEAELTSTLRDRQHAEAQPFSPEERKLLVGKLADIESELVGAVSHNEEFETYVRSEFAALRTELAEMRRGEWIKMFWGTLVNLVVSGVVPPERMEAAVNSVKSLLAQGWARLMGG